eukprot:36940_1
MDDFKFPDNPGIRKIMKPDWVSDKFTDHDLTELKKRGNAYFKTGDYDAALPYYLAILHRTKHVNQNSKLIMDSYNNIALIYFKAHKYYKCIDKCNTVLAMDPNQDKALFRRKKSYFILQKANQEEKQPNKWSEFPLIHPRELKKMGIASSPLYEVRKIPLDVNKMGFFATKPIQCGTIILKEKPLFKLKKHSDDMVCFGPNGMIERVSGHSDKIQQIIHYLPKKQGDMFTTMRASDVEMSDHYHNIYLTNNIIITNGEYGAIFPTGSRFNHCCVGNTSGWFDKTTAKYHIVAVQDIAKGEQLCTSFISSIPLKREDRRDELLKLYGFVCECQYCNFETCDRYEEYTKEFVVLRLKLLNMMSNQQSLKAQNPFEIVKRILYIFEHYYDSNAYYMDDYTEHAFLCALVKGDLKQMVRYAALHTFWYNMKHGFILDDGKKQYEHKWKVPEVVKSKKLHEVVQKVVDCVISEKQIPQCLYEGPFADE